MYRIAIASAFLAAFAAPSIASASTIPPFYGTEDNFIVELHGQKNLEPHYSVLRDFSTTGLDTRSLSYNGMLSTGSATVGSLKASASVPGLSGSDTHYGSSSFVGYRDVVTFESAVGADTVDLTYHFNIDGFYANNPNAYNAVQMTVQIQGEQGSVFTTMPAYTHFKDGVLMTPATEGMTQEQFNSWYVGDACFDEGGLTRCRPSNTYHAQTSQGSFETTSDLTFTVKAGQEYEVWVFFSVNASTFNTTPSSWDFSHTVTFAGLTAPPDTEVTSEFFGKFTPDSTGLLNYAATPAVPEPESLALVFAGLTVIGLARKKRHYIPANLG